MPEYKVECCKCGKPIIRQRKIIINKYGVWKPKCKSCKVSDYREKQAAKVKARYQNDPDFRQKVLDRSKERYWSNRKPIQTLTIEDKRILASLNSYPVLGEGCLGTSEITTNWKIVEKDGEKRIKGALFLENFGKKRS